MIKESELQVVPATAIDLYLGLLKKSLTFLLYSQKYLDVHSEDKKDALNFIRPTESDIESRMQGHDWPELAHTMIGIKRLDNIQRCLEAIIKDEIPGNLIETGVWRGGASIFMRAVLAAYQISDRTVWVADSFRGLPRPDKKHYPADSEDKLYSIEYLAVSLEEVKANFRSYGLLDRQVRFLPGWFRDSLPSLKNEKWAFVRLDGDMYESTMNGLDYLYPNLSPGGFIVVDDYWCFESCRNAVHDFRKAHNITDEIITIDWSGAYWRRSRNQ